MKWPFSAYDLFAHVASGATILFAAALARGADMAGQSAVQISMLSIAAYTLGHVVAQIASLVLEGLLVKKLLGSPEVRLLQSRKGLARRLFPGYFTVLPEEARLALTRRLELESAPTEPGRGMFLHCWARVRNEPDARERLDSFLNLYGFCRNMALAAAVSALLIARAAASGNFDTGEGRWIVTTLGLVAVVLIYRYLKYFRLYTQEVFVRFSSMTVPEPESQS